MWTSFSTLIAGVAAYFGTTLLSGVLVESHEGVGYFNHGCLPACVSQTVEYPGWRWRVIVLDR